MTERLVIDLAACDRCEACTVGPAVLALRERATFELVCRRCEQPSCVMACPFDALERTVDGIVKRHNMRCVSCKSCSLACPFGTIYMELLPYYSMDYEAAVSLVRASLARDQNGGAAGGREQGSLLQWCKCGALDYGEVDPEDPQVHIVDDFLAAKVRRWDREDRGEEAA